MRKNNSLAKPLWILVSIAIVLICAIIAWFIEPRWTGLNEWRAQDYPLQGLEQLTGGTTLPATGSDALPECANPQPAYPVPIHDYLKQYRITELHLLRSGCLEMSHATRAGQRYPVFDLFILWLHLLYGVALQQDAADIPEQPYPQPPLRLLMPTEQLQQTVERLAWGSPVSRVMRDDKQQWTLQKLSLELERLTGQSLDKQLQDRLRRPLSIGEDAVLAHDSLGAPLTVCCYYASAEEVIRVGLAYLQNTQVQVPPGWTGLLPGGRQLGKSARLFAAHGQYLYWDMQYDVLVYLRVGQMVGPNDSSNLIELMGLLARPPAGEHL